MPTVEEICEACERPLEDLTSSRDPFDGVADLNIGRNVHKLFFKRFMASDDCKHLILVAPYITPMEDESINLEKIVKRVNEKNMKLTVFTTLINESKYIKALEIIKQAVGGKIYVNDTLHAKFYICRRQKNHFALLGSANISSKSFKNYETGLLVRNRSWGERVVEELTNKALHELRIEDRTIEIN